MTSTARIPKDGYALRLRNVSVTLGGVQILSNVTAQPAVGALNAIIGPNGAGKTTLLRAILGLVPYTGTIQIGQTVEGEPLRLPTGPLQADTRLRVRALRADAPDGQAWLTAEVQVQVLAPPPTPPAPPP